LPFGTPDKTVDRATVDPRRRHPEILFAMAWKPCSFCRGIGINFAVEFVFFLPWNPCSLWRGIFMLGQHRDLRGNGIANSLGAVAS
jgi:hypothetical protein